MSYRDTARNLATAEAPNLPPHHKGSHAADKLPMSDWAESRRAGMTPETIAANHALHVSDTAHELRQTVATIRERGAWAGELVTWEEAARLLADRAAALLAAIGEAGE